MSEDSTLSIEQLRQWVGKEEDVVDLLTPAGLQKFNATLTGVAAELIQTANSALAPHGLHWCTALNAVSAEHLASDGHPATGGFLPPVPLPRRMWASGRLTFHQPLTIGESIARRSRIADIQLKKGSNAAPLVFVDVEHTLMQNQKACITETQTLVYRQAASKNTTATPAAKHHGVAPQGHAITIIPSHTLLFRYSALTFNAHRIHYDQAYTTAVEGYRNLVVHGPLMATLLMQFAGSLRPDAAMTSFEFRGTAPAFVNEALMIVACNNDLETLEIRGAQNQLIMQASARLEG